MDKRRILFWLAFLGGAALLAAIPEYFADDAGEVVQPVAGRRAPSGPRTAPSAAARAGAETVAPSAAVLAAAARAAPPEVDLFAAHSWHVAPPPPPPAPARAAPPPPPVAPPMPFQFVGKLDDSETLRVFLQRGERIHTVSAGDVIDGTYRVERITGTHMTLIYLPLNIAQTLSVGSNL